VNRQFQNVKNFTKFSFSFDFGNKNKDAIPVSRQSVKTFKLLDNANPGDKCDAIFLWWDIIMDPRDKITLSCAPKWAHPDKGTKQIVIFSILILSKMYKTESGQKNAQNCQKKLIFSTPYCTYKTLKKIFVAYYYFPNNSSLGVTIGCKPFTTQPTAFK
jgi:hypothetical protein